MPKYTIGPHKIKISQQYQDQGLHYTTLMLSDEDENGSPLPGASGNFEYTKESYDNSLIEFSSANVEWLHWKWTYLGGMLFIGEKDYVKNFFPKLTLVGIFRDAGGKFYVPNKSKGGAGLFMWNRPPHFEAGSCQWEIVPY